MLSPACASSMEMGSFWELPHSGNQRKPEAKARAIAPRRHPGTDLFEHPALLQRRCNGVLAWLHSASLWDPEQGWFCHRLAVTEPALLLELDVKVFSMLKSKHLAAQLSSWAAFLQFFTHDPSPAPRSHPEGCSQAERSSKRAETWGRGGAAPGAFRHRSLPRWVVKRGRGLSAVAGTELRRFDSSQRAESCVMLAAGSLRAQAGGQKRSGPPWLTVGMGSPSPADPPRSRSCRSFFLCLLWLWERS